KARFMDLPSSVFLGLMDRDHGTAVLVPDEPEEKKGDSDDDANDDAEDEKSPPELADKPARASLYDKVAHLAGEPDYETYWERHFEQLRERDTYWNAAQAYGQELRTLEDFSTRMAAENLLREAYMRRKIQQAIAEGF